MAARFVFLVTLCVFLFEDPSQAADANTALPGDLSAFKCAKEAQGLSARWGARGDWQRQIDPAAGAFAYRSPTDHFGVWVEVQGYPGEPLIATRLTERSRTNVKFDAKDCAPTIAVHKDGLRGNGKWLGDAELQALIKKSPKGVLFLWSPRFGHSFAAFDELKKAAKQAGVTVHTAMDPSAEAVLVRQTASRAKDVGLDSTPFSAMELIARNVQGHFPRTIVFSGGAIAGPMITGANSSEHFAKEIGRRIAAARTGAPGGEE